MRNIMKILFAISLIVNLYWGWYFYLAWFPHEVNIPSQDQINNFCQHNGFDYGWLSSSSCQENQVQCSRDLMGLQQYKCVNWTAP